MPYTRKVVDAPPKPLTASYWVLARHFEIALRAENLAPRTISSYVEAVTQLGEYLKAQNMPLEPSDISAEHLREFLVYLQTKPHHHTGQPLKATTVSNRYKSLQAYFKWLTDEGEIKVSPLARISPPKIPENSVPVLSEAELHRLLDTCSGADFNAKRDAAILRVLIDTGMRRNEITNIRCQSSDDPASDIDWTHNEIEVIAKGRRSHRYVFGK